MTDPQHSSSPTSNAPAESSPLQSHLDRVLGRRDLILLFVVAVANLNIVPAIAASGPMTLWLWLASLAFYFWPQGVAVTELSQQWPTEGGIYLWAKNSFGEGHGFFAAWCYWLSNVVYLPTVLLSCVGVGVYVFGPRAQALVNSERFTAGVAAALLLFLLALNVRGQAAGKWITNLGGVGTVGGALLVCGLAALTLHRHQSALSLQDLKPHGGNLALFAALGTIIYSLQGLELASIMGDEIREPRKVLPGAILWGGVISGGIYVSVTLAMLIALPHQRIGVLSGVLQAVSTMASGAHLRLVVAPLALFEFIAILGTASAWFSGSARLPFVAGIDSYLPPALGKLHPGYHTPHIALCVFAVMSAMLILLSYLGASVGEGYLTLLSIAVILQMVPNLYMFAALYRSSLHHKPDGTSRAYLLLNAVSGMFFSLLGFGLSFVPAAAASSIWLYEAKLVAVVSLVCGCALFFYVRGTSKRQAEIPHAR